MSEKTAALPKTACNVFWCRKMWWATAIFSTSFTNYHWGRKVKSVVINFSTTAHFFIMCVWNYLDRWLESSFPMTNIEAYSCTLNVTSRKFYVDSTIISSIIKYNMFLDTRRHFRTRCIGWHAWCVPYSSSTTKPEWSEFLWCCRMMLP